MRPTPITIIIIIIIITITNEHMVTMYIMRSISSGHYAPEHKVHSPIDHR